VVGQTRTSVVCFADEMRLGLISQLRRRWCPVGVKLVQPQQMCFVWRWLSLAVEVTSGKLFWRWQENLKAASVAQTVQAWSLQGLSALVWDNAPGHTGGVVGEAGLPLVFLPPCSPELNPAERVFEEVRRRVEGSLYDTIEAKVAVVESFLSELAADAERVRQLAGWDWIVEALQSLPVPVPNHVA